MSKQITIDVPDEDYLRIKDASNSFTPEHDMTSIEKTVISCFIRAIVMYEIKDRWEKGVRDGSIKPINFEGKKTSEEV
jgi:hypothetical protein